MAFKFTLLSDVRSFLKGAADVEKSLDDVADSLDDLARDTAQNAEEAGDKLAREFSDAFDKVKTEAKDAGKRIGDDVKRGTAEASEGTDTFRENAASNAKEVAASFDGSAESILDGFQGLAAEALEGFGPAGVAAGVAVAAGVGLAVGALQDAKEKADEAADEVHDLVQEIEDAGSATKTLAENMRDYMLTTVDSKEWWEVWQDGPTDALALMQKFGISRAEMVKYIEGDTATAEKWSKVLSEGVNTDWGVDTSGQKLLDFMEQKRVAYERAGEAAGSQELAEQRAAEAGEEAAQRQADAAKEFADSLKSSVDDAIASTGKLVDNGKVSIEKWVEGVERAQRRARRIEKFTVDVLPEFSPEAQQRFAELPTETQNQIVRAYRNGTKGEKRKIRQTLEIDADPKVNVAPAQVEANKNPVKIPTTVDTRLAADQAGQAADAAQREANRHANEIEFATRIDRDELQRQVNRAAASITPPTITVKTRVQKEVP